MRALDTGRNTGRKRWATELANELGMYSSPTARVLKRMEEDGLITRARESFVEADRVGRGNRRRIYCELTDYGQRFMPAVYADLARLEGRHDPPPGVAGVAWSTPGLDVSVMRGEGWVVQVYRWPSTTDGGAMT
jgi:DNA-binding Lrp family transcriptional regulator